MAGHKVLAPRTAPPAELASSTQVAAHLAGKTKTFSQYHCIRFCPCIAATVNIPLFSTHAHAHTAAHTAVHVLLFNVLHSQRKQCPTCSCPNIVSSFVRQGAHMCSFIKSQYVLYVHHGSRQRSRNPAALSPPGSALATRQRSRHPAGALTCWAVKRSVLPRRSHHAVSFSLTASSITLFTSIPALLFRNLQHDFLVHFRRLSYYRYC